MADVRVNRKFKDSLFRMIFSEKEALLELYNAINGSDHQNPEDLTITTIDDVLYLGMKNDVSFLIGKQMNLYEAQSSLNPNMPLRGLFYFSRLYQAYIKERQLDPYSQRLLPLPAPKFVVFYNGTKEQPDRVTLRLSDAFSPEAGVPCLECTATMLNINCGHNEELMKGCRKLYEYAYLVDRVRCCLNQGLRLEAAINQAVEDCIKNDILKGFLLKHREEVREMILSEYDQELHIRSEKAISFEEGEKAGQERGEERINSLYTQLAKAGRTEDMVRAATDPAYQKQLFKELGL